MTLSHRDGSKTQSDDSRNPAPTGSLRCVPLKLSEGSGKALSTSDDQIPWASLECFQKTLATAAPLNTPAEIHSEMGHPLTFGK